jgi:hypothetical protein
MALAGVLAPVSAGAGGRPGVLGGLVVTGTSGWTYTVSGGHLATSKGATDGVAVWANDADTTVATSVAPGTGSRVDIVYALHRDVDAGDANSAPTFGVAQGVAAPAGAVELARFTIPAGATGTAGGTADVSQRQWSALRGVPIPVTGTAQRDAITWGSMSNPARVWRIDKGFVEVNTGGGWFRADGAGPSRKSTRAPASAAISVANASGAPGQTIVFDTVIWDDGITYSTSANSFTFPLSGRYAVSARVVFAANAAGNRFLTYTLSTGEVVIMAIVPGTASNPTIVQGSDELTAVAGDRISINARQTSGAALDIVGSQSTLLPAATVVIRYLGPA